MEKMSTDSKESQDDPGGAEVEMEEGEDSADESDSGSDHSVEETKGKLESLQEKIALEPWIKENHINLIGFLQKKGDLEKLREAREAFSKVFPLSEEMWMSWVRDEIGIAVTESETLHVIELFRRALQDTFSLDVWLQYCLYMVGVKGSKDQEAVVGAFEEALQAVGHHVLKGSVIWDAYREFLLQIDEGGKERRLEVLRRQMSLPLLGNADTFAELQKSDPSPIADDIKEALQDAITILAPLQEFEEVLLRTEGKEMENLEAYKAYLDQEQTLGDRERLCTLYERALEDHPTQAWLWREYIRFLKGQDKALDACRRAVQHCPASAGLWTLYMRFAERTGASQDVIDGILERALEHDFQRSDDYRMVWLGYLDYLRRLLPVSKEVEQDLQVLRDAFNRACEYLAEYFGLGGDRECLILQYWASMEARHGNMERARVLWGDIMSQGHAKSSDMWLRFAQLERLHGDAKHCRRVFTRALAQAIGSPEKLIFAWLSFEREEGTIDSFESCLEKCEERQRKWKHEQREMDKERKMKVKWGRDQGRGKGAKDQTKGQETQRRARETVAVHGEKRKLAPEQEDKKEGDETSPVKKARIETGMSQVNLVDQDGFKIPQSVANGDQATGKIPLAPHKDPKTEHGETIHHDASKDDRTLFLSNLAYDVDEPRILSLFADCPGVVQFRLVRDYRGRSKGFGYLEFESKARAEPALRKDRDTIDGRPVFVSRCESDQRLKGQAFRFNNCLEKNKLFLKGLPPETTKEDLEEIFGKYKGLKGVRIVTFRNGHSKGIAYVEYTNENSAKEALVGTDGMQIGEKTVSVSFSNPPTRGTREYGDATSVLQGSLGRGAPPPSGGRGKGRTGLSLLPRSVQKAGNPSPSPFQKDESSGSSSGSSSSGGSEKSQTLSNDDFRQMLLGRK